MMFMLLVPYRRQIPPPQKLRARVKRYANGTINTNADVFIFPKVIHQMWKTGSSPPSETIRWREGCKAVNTGYTFNMYDDDQLLLFATEHYAKYLPMFKKLTGVCKLPTLILVEC